MTTADPAITAEDRSALSAATLPPRAEMEGAHARRDADYDGIFVVAVRSTGIFCKPSCPARRPRPANVEYFAAARDAAASGYRPCKRCQPLHPSVPLPGWARGLVAELDADPDTRLGDADLRARGLDPARVRRTFRRQFGQTFQAYARERRLGVAKRRLRAGEPLDDVITGHGFESYSGFREAFARTFGAPPGAGRHADCIVADWVESPLGPLLAAATSAGLCLLEYTGAHGLPEQASRLARRLGLAVVPGESEVLALAREELAAYFDGRLREFTVPLVVAGTPFQEAVWAELRRTPYGRTRPYQDIARAVGRPAATRAVGRANGTNPLAILIPCHRVVQKDGTLGGYGGGLWRKRRLLELEGVKRLGA